MKTIFLFSSDTLFPYKEDRLVRTLANLYQKTEVLVQIALCSCAHLIRDLKTGKGSLEEFRIQFVRVLEGEDGSPGLPGSPRMDKTGFDKDIFMEDILEERKVVSFHAFKKAWEKSVCLSPEELQSIRQLIDFKNTQGNGLKIVVAMCLDFVQECALSEQFKKAGIFFKAERFSAQDAQSVDISVVCRQALSFYDRPEYTIVSFCPQMQRWSHFYAAFRYEQYPTVSWLLWWAETFMHASNVTSPVSTVGRRGGRTESVFRREIPKEISNTLSAPVPVSVEAVVVSELVVKESESFAARFLKSRFIQRAYSTIENTENEENVLARAPPKQETITKKENVKPVKTPVPPAPLSITCPSSLSPALLPVLSSAVSTPSTQRARLRFMP